MELGAQPLIVTRSFSFEPSPDRLDSFAGEIESALPVACRNDLIRVGLVEALSNAIMHGVLRVASDKRDAGDLEGFLEHMAEAQRSVSPSARITVYVHLDARGATVVVRDPGPGFNASGTARRPSRGLSILHAVFNRVEWNRTGNTVSLRIECDLTAEYVADPSQAGAA